MSNDAHFDIKAHLDRGHLQEGIITITRDTNLFKVRAKRGREYSLELATVAEMVVARCIKHELQDAGKPVPRGRK